MPRPRSEITKGVYVNVRMSVKQKEMFQDLGGADFLRNYLDRQIRSEESTCRRDVGGGYQPCS